MTMFHRCRTLHLAAGLGFAGAAVARAQTITLPFANGSTRWCSIRRSGH